MRRRRFAGVICLLRLIQKACGDQLELLYQNYLEDVARDLGLKSARQAFCSLALSEVLRRQSSSHIDDPFAFITDGAGDQGVDAIYINRRQRFIELFNFRYTNNPKRGHAKVRLNLSSLQVVKSLYEREFEFSGYVNSRLKRILSRVEAMSDSAYYQLRFHFVQNIDFGGFNDVDARVGPLYDMCDVVFWRVFFRHEGRPVIEVEDVFAVSKTLEQSSNDDGVGLPWESTSSLNQFLARIEGIAPVLALASRSLPQQPNDSDTRELSEVIERLLERIEVLQRQAIENEGKIADLERELEQARATTKRSLNEFVSRSLDSVADEAGPTLRWALVGGSSLAAHALLSVL